MADLHLHLLPGVDDGPTDWAATEAMLKAMAESGVEIAATTPHVGDGESVEQALSKHEGLAKLQRLGERYGIHIVGAAEFWATPDLPDHFDSFLPLTYGGMGKYALVEFSVTEMPLFTEWLIFHLKVRGVTPIIAHPERYAWVQQDERNLWRLLVQGALVQVTADALLNPNTPPGRMAWRLLRSGVVDFIASDWHAPEPQPYPLKAAMQKLRGTTDERQVERLVWDVPWKILSGQSVRPAWQSSPMRDLISAAKKSNLMRYWWHRLERIWRRKE